jgi:hypothetical protein
MKIGFFSSMTAMLAGTSVALAQAPTPAVPGSPARTVVVQNQPMPAAPAAGPMTGAVMPPVQSFSSDDTSPGSGCCQAPTVADDPGLNPYTVFGGAEYILWHMKRAPLPPLVAQEAGDLQLSSSTTTVASDGTLVSRAVQLFNVPVVIGVTPGVAQGTDVNLGYQRGARVFAGVWLDSQDTIGVEARGFLFEHRSFPFNNTTARLNNGSVNVPFNNQVIILPPQNGGTLVGGSATITNTPIILNTSGSVTLLGKADNQFWGVEANVRALCAVFGSARFEVIAGFRSFDLQESLVTNTTLVLQNTVQPPIPPQQAANGLFQSTDPTNPFGPPQGSNALPTPAPAPIPFGNIVFNDRISTRNIFYGGQLGLNADVWCGRVNLKGSARVGVGDMHQIITIDNNNSSTLAGGNISSVNGGGLLTGAADKGRFTHEKVCWMTDVNAQLGYLVCPWMRAYVGYDFLNLTQVARPGGQVVFTNTTTTVNIAGQPSTATIASPGFTFFSENLWVQGLSFGVELRF